MKTSTLSQIELETIAQALETTLDLFECPDLNHMDIHTGTTKELDEALNIVNGHLQHITKVDDMEYEPIDPEDFYTQQKEEEQAEQFFDTNDEQRFPEDDYLQDMGC